ncbi:hypothetical protein SAMN04487831_11074 [Pseudobutyrivibrio sp. UC1225]|uniref:hypothetical protein n=1 Tax=Pseudobutyrivibrio sp. UC1225 TaxID=1798185 RepID=UPI0008E937E2|nr:hypothetical protein [Pseudobutyrivibrio sp. UC1225]SFO17151.1 hypothetical protein SAMN04487831_11074 [Pseudobutyrivibrio sp. UC1225]
MKRKVLAQLLAFGLALTSLPVSVSAAEITEDVVVEAEPPVADEDTQDVEELEQEEATAEADEDEDVDVDDVVDDASEDLQEVTASKITINDETYYFLANSDDLTSDSVIVLENTDEEKNQTEFSSFTEIDDTDVYFYTTADLSGKLYGTYEASYTDLYRGQTSAPEYDAVSSATKGKSNLFTSTNVSDVTDDGYQIYGLKNANVAVSKEDYVKASILDSADKLDNDSYANLLKITLNENNDIPSYYLPYDGSEFKNAVIRKSISVNDAEGELRYYTRYGTYQLEVLEPTTSYLRRTRDNDIYAINNSVHGAILRGTDSNGNPISMGVRHLKELWVSTYEIAFSPDTNSAVSFEGGYITSVDYLTASDVFSFKFETPVKVKATYDSSALSTFFNENNNKELIISGIDTVLQNTTLSLSYREGRQSVTVVDKAPVTAVNGVIKYTVEDELIPEKSYTVTLVNDEYADITSTVTPETLGIDPSAPAEPDEPTEPDSPDEPVIDNPDAPDEPVIDNPDAPDEPAIDTPTEPAKPSTDNLTDEQKECVKCIDKKIKEIVDCVVVPIVKKCCPQLQDVIPVITQHLQMIQTKIFNFFFGRW